MRNSAWGFARCVAVLVAITGCSGYSTVGRSGNLVPAGTVVPFVRVMTPGTAQDYIGADVSTNAEFVGAGAGEVMLIIPMDDRIAFRCKAPGETLNRNPLSGDLEARLIVAPKALADSIYALKPGDLITLRGGTHVSKAQTGNYFQVIFVATDIARAE